MSRPKRDLKCARSCHHVIMIIIFAICHHYDYEKTRAGSYIMIIILAVCHHDNNHYDNQQTRAGSYMCESSNPVGKGRSKEITLDIKCKMAVIMMTIMIMIIGHDHENHDDNDDHVGHLM